MSGKINGNGGLGEIFKRILSANNAPAEATPASEPAKAPKVQGDVNLIGNNGGLSRLTLAAGLESTQSASASDLVRNAKDLNDLINTVSRGEFPGLKLSPVQAAGLATYLRDQLEIRGFNDQSFKQIKDQLG